MIHKYTFFFDLTSIFRRHDESKQNGCAKKKEQFGNNWKPTTQENDAKIETNTIRLSNEREREKKERSQLCSRLFRQKSSASSYLAELMQWIRNAGIGKYLQTKFTALLCGEWHCTLRDTC